MRGLHTDQPTIDYTEWVKNPFREAISRSYGDFGAWSCGADGAGIASGAPPGAGISPPIGGADGAVMAGAGAAGAGADICGAAIGAGAFIGGAISAGAGAISGAAAGGAIAGVGAASAAAGAGLAGESGRFRRFRASAAGAVAAAAGFFAFGFLCALWACFFLYSSVPGPFMTRPGGRLSVFREGLASLITGRRCVAPLLPEAAAWPEAGSLRLRITAPEQLFRHIPSGSWSMPLGTSTAKAGALKTIARAVMMTYFFIVLLQTTLNFVQASRPSAAAFSTLPYRD